MAAKLEGKYSEKKQWHLHKSLPSLIILVFITAVAGALAYQWFGAPVVRVRPDKSSNSSSSINKVEEVELFITPPNKLNILLMGVDERPKEDDPGRSDTLLVLMIDTTTRKVALLSVPRDTRVRVDGIGWDKINHAFMFGGVALTQQTTENFLGIPVDYYAKVDMESFGRVVNAIGGVTIDVEERMEYEDTWEHFVIDLKQGIQRLDGRTALQYVRYRDEDGDIGRVRRQQKFIKAVFAEMNTLAIIPKLPGIIREVFASLDTNMPMPLMLGLARQLKDGLSNGFKADIVVGLPYYIDDISYWVPDVMKTSQKVAEMQGVPFSGNIQAAAQRMADEYRRNLPGNAYLDDGAYYSGVDKSPIKTDTEPTIAQKTTTSPLPTTTKQKTPLSNNRFDMQSKDRLLSPK